MLRVYRSQLCLYLYTHVGSGTPANSIFILNIAESKDYTNLKAPPESSSRGQAWRHREGKQVFVNRDAIRHTLQSTFRPYLRVAASSPSTLSTSFICFYSLLKCALAYDMAQWLNGLATNPDSLGAITETQG